MSWESLVKNIAPAIGTALGGPAGGMAVKFLADSLLGAPDASEADVIRAIQNASPETMLKLKNLDQQFEAKMKELDVDVFHLEIDDRKNARDLFKINIWPQIILSAIYIIGYFTVLVVVLTGTIEIPAANQSLVNVLIGVLTGAVPMILQFWFGSSLGSKEKTQRLNGPVNG